MLNSFYVKLGVKYITSNTSNILSSFFPFILFVHLSTHAFCALLLMYDVILVFHISLVNLVKWKFWVLTYFTRRFIHFMRLDIKIYRLNHLNRGCRTSNHLSPINQVQLFSKSLHSPTYPNQPFHPVKLFCCSHINKTAYSI